MIAVLTYDHPHRTTQDLLLTLAAHGRADGVHVIATPWQERRNFVPLYPHRWFEPLDVALRTLCHRLGMEFEPVLIDEWLGGV